MGLYAASLGASRARGRASGETQSRPGNAEPLDDKTSRQPLVALFSSYAPLHIDIWKNESTVRVPAVG